MKSISKIAVITILLSLVSFSLFSQETMFKVDRNVNMFFPDSEVKNISLNVQEKTSSLLVEIVSEVMFGSLTIEIYNPKKEKLGEFSVERQTPISDKEKKEYTEFKDYLGEFVSGEIQKYIKNPVPGKWIVKIIPRDAIGKIKIQSKSQMND